jgi:phospholipase C
MLTRRTVLQLMAASGAALTAPELLAQTAANAAPALTPAGSGGISHVVILMMENRSFDHFLSWLPGADGRNDLVFQSSTDGNFYPNYPLAPDFQGCGYSDPDHSWEGFLVEHNFGKMDGFLQRPTQASGLPGVTLAAANTFPIGYYSNVNPGGSPKVVPDLPVTGALAQRYTVLDRYFCSFAGETFPNRFYQHAARTDRDHNTATPSTLATIWDQLSALPNSQGIPTGAYFFRDLPYLALWGGKYAAFWRPFYTGEPNALGIPDADLRPSFLDTVAAGNLPNVSFIDPAFDTEGNGTSADDHPLADIRLGERFIADAYHALADAGYLDSTVFVITFDEWGGFYDHVPPPHVIDDTDPSTVDHSGDGTTPTDGQLIPDYTQLGFRVPAIVVSSHAAPRVVSGGPYEHTSTLRFIETTFGLQPLTARDANAQNLGQVLLPAKIPLAARGAIPTSSQVPGPDNDADAVCSATSVQSVSPAPVGTGQPSPDQALIARAGWPSGSGMVNFGKQYRGS